MTLHTPKGPANDGSTYYRRYQGKDYDASPVARVGAHVAQPAASSANPLKLLVLKGLKQEDRRQVARTGER